MHREERFCASPDSDHHTSKEETRRHHRRGGRHDRSSSCSRSSDDEKDVSNASTRRRRSSSSSRSSWRRRRGNRRNSSSGSSGRRTPHRRRRSPRSSFRYSREGHERRRSSYSRRGGEGSERFRSPRHRYSRGSPPPPAQSSSRQQAPDHGLSVSRSRWLGKTNTVMARELPTFLDEAEIREDLMTLGFTITDLRLVRRKDTGVSRGFGFIDLISAEEAERFLEYTQGSYLLLNEYPITLLPSPPRWESDDYRYHRGVVDASRDWECIRCGIRNFKRREFCFKCNLSKEDSDRGRELDGSEAISAVPCNTLVLRGLNPVLVSKEYIMNIIERSLNGSNIKPLDAFVVPGQRDDDRSFPFRQCNSFAFVEFSTIHEATVAMEKLKNLEPEPLIIDGFEALVDFARAAFVICVEEYSGGHRGKMFRQSVAGNPMLMAMHQHGSVPIVSAAVSAASSGAADSAAQYWPQQQGVTCPTDWSVMPVNHAAYASSCDRADQLQTMGSQADQANVGAAVAQAALKNLQAVKHRTIGDHSTYEREPKGKSKSSAAAAATEMPQADTMEGEAAGDAGQMSALAAGQTVMPTMGPNAMYWDGSQWVYLSAVGVPPVPVIADQSSQVPGQQLVRQAPSTDDQGKQSKISVAKKIAKEMEKWASSQNKQKAAASKRSGVMHQQSAMPAAASAASVQRQQQQQILLQRATLSATEGAASKASLNPTARLSFSLQANNNLVSTRPLVASAYGSGEQSDDGDDKEGEKKTQDNCPDKLVDWAKLACLLCKRKFNSKEVLDKHLQMSALHKENLAKLEGRPGDVQKSSAAVGVPVEAAPSATEFQQRYRDRAKERREMYSAARRLESKCDSLPPVN